MFDLENDPDEMEKLFFWSGFKVHPDYAAILPGLVDQLNTLRTKYRDTTGKPVKMWPVKDYD